MGLNWGLVVIGFLFGIWEFIKVHQQLKDNARDIESRRGDLHRTDKGLRRRDREYEEGMDRLKLANFLMLNGKTVEAVEVLTGRISYGAVRAELLDLRKTLAKGGKIDPIWVIEETRIKEI